MLARELARFDFTWFVPAIVKYRKQFAEVIAASFFLQVLALITPLFFQVIIDKVLVHNGLTTLDVLAIGLEHRPGDDDLLELRDRLLGEGP